MVPHVSYHILLSKENTCTTEGSTYCHWYGALTIEPYSVQIHKDYKGETKWQTLKERLDCHCLCLFYKIVNCLTPSYLSSVLLERPAHGYNLRYFNDFSNILYRTNKYFESFIPATIRLWNGLAENVCQSETLEVFKNALNRNLSKPNPWFYIGPRKDAIHLTRF